VCTLDASHLSHATHEFESAGLGNRWQTGPGRAISAMGGDHRQQTAGPPAAGAAQRGLARVRAVRSSLIPGVCDGTLLLSLARRGVVEHHKNWVVDEAVLATFRWVAVGIFLLTPTIRLSRSSVWGFRAHQARSSATSSQ
jgi:hypothetical protein